MNKDLKEDLRDAFENAFPETTEGERLPLTLDKYQKLAMTTSTETSDNLTYMGFGLIAEAGEVADKIAKAVRKKEISLTANHVYVECDNEVFRQFVENIKKELGDVLWFVAGMADQFGFSLSDVAETNLKKIAERKKAGTIITHTDH